MAAHPNVTEITREKYTRDREQGYAGPLTTLHGAHTRERYEEIGADAWQLALEDGRTVLRPVKVIGGAE